MGPSLTIRAAGRGWGTIAYVLILTALGACRRDQTNSGSVRLPPAGALVAVVGTSQSDPCWPAIRGGAQRYDAEREYVVCLAAAPPEDASDALLLTVEDVLAKSPAAVCLCVDDPTTARPAAERIAAEGLVLVTVGRPIPGILAYGQVDVGWPEGAEMLGSSLRRLLPEAVGRFGQPRTQRSYVLVHEAGRGDLASQCYVRFVTSARKWLEPTLLEERDASDRSVPVHQLIQDMLARFPTTELIVTLDPDPWLSRQPHLALPQREGPDGRPIFVNRFATLGASPRLWPRLESGEAVALVGPLDGELGYAAVDLAMRGVMAIANARTREVVRCELVTRDTLPDFAQRYAMAANLPLEELPPVRALTTTTAPADGG